MKKSRNFKKNKKKGNRGSKLSLFQKDDLKFTKILNC